MLKLPCGTVTFLFTDIEGSTIRWERYPGIMRTAVSRHDVLLNSCMERHNGVVFKRMGDAFYVAFATAGDALEAALNAQRTLLEEEWPKDINSLRIRIALHTGEAESRDADYFGQTLNRVARILSAGHGGQVLLSLTTRELVHNTLPHKVTLYDLGEHRLKDIQHPEHIFQVMAPDLLTDFPPLKTLDRHPNNLPTQLTPFVGRQVEIEEVSVILKQKDARLVTLIGPGGIGKTRLSLQIAAEIVDFFPDGVYFVELSASRGSDAALAAIAQTLGIQESGDLPLIERIKKHLGGQEVLLLLDNFEQLTDSTGIVFNLLIACPGLKTLVASRAALHIGGEREYHIRTFNIPDLAFSLQLNDLPRYEAIALFIQQACAVKRDFRLTEANASAIVQICQQLDGLPLAIELAAARVNILPPQAMLKRLASRLKLLKGEKRDRPDRQQTLRDTIAWSYDLLTSEEKTLFIRLSIFTGGCTLEAIETICLLEEDADFDILDLLKSLIDKSLLRPQEQENGESRFTMLHTIHEFAREHLSEVGETGNLKLRHFEYYLCLAEEALSCITGNEQKFWLNRLDDEHKNLVAALDWCSEQFQIEAGLRLSSVLWRFWLIRGHLHEGRRWLETFLSSNDSLTVSPSVRAKALEGAAALACRQKDYERATIIADEALALSKQLDNQEFLHGVYIALAEVAFLKGDSQRAAISLEESLNICRSLGDKRGAASLLNNLGNIALQQGKISRAAVFFEESHTLFHEVGDKLAIASVLNNLGEVEWHRNNFEQAIILYEESLKLSRELGYTWGIAASLVNMSNYMRYYGDHQNALEQYQESLKLFNQLGDKLGIAFCLEGIAEIAHVQKLPEQAIRLFAQADIIRQAIGATTQHNRAMHENTIASLKATLGRSSFELIWKKSIIITLEHVIREAIALSKSIIN